jgi:hypothetical protein
MISLDLRNCQVTLRSWRLLELRDNWLVLVLYLGRAGVTITLNSDQKSRRGGFVGQHGAEA